MCDKIMHKKCKTNDNIVEYTAKSALKPMILFDTTLFFQAPRFANNGLIDDEPVNYIESIHNSSKIYLSTLFFNIDGTHLIFFPTLAEGKKIVGNK